MKYRAGSMEEMRRRLAGIFCSTQSSPRRTSSRGFTLIEMIVAVALFAVVMIVAVTALLSLVSANRKAQALQSVINNLNIAVDGMSRSIREGSTYRCGSSNPSNPNCPDGGASFYFQPHCSPGPDQTCPKPDWVYLFDPGTHRIYKSENGFCDPSSTCIPITAPEVSIDSATFYVIGANRGDGIQPKVLIVIQGTAGSLKATVRTTFHVQSTAVQRVLDI